MCMEDIRLGRQLGPQAKAVLVPTATVTALLPPDPNRTRIVVSGNGVDLLYVTPEDMTPGTATGFCLTPTRPQMVIRVEEWGRLVGGAWRAYTDGANMQVGVMTATLEKH